MWSDLPASVEHPGAPKGRAALLGDEGGKTALRGGYIRFEASVLERGQGDWWGFLVLRYLAHLQPETMVAEREGGVRRGEGDLSERGVALKLRGVVAVFHNSGRGVMPEYPSGCWTSCWTRWRPLEQVHSIFLIDAKLFVFWS